jgi:hypothetical protein
MYFENSQKRNTAGCNVTQLNTQLEPVYGKTTSLLTFCWLLV